MSVCGIDPGIAQGIQFQDDFCKMSYVLISDQEVALFDFDNECYGDLEAPGKRPPPSLSKHCPVKKDRQTQHMVMSQWCLMNGNGYLIAYIPALHLMV